MKEPESFADSLHFNDAGLIPVVVQDAASHEVLMLAWMNRDAVILTLAEHRTVFWSRSRRELWRKGETSGNTQKLVSLSSDCDADTLLAVVQQHGPACHTGADTCFTGRTFDSTVTLSSESETTS